MSIFTEQLKDGTKLILLGLFQYSWFPFQSTSVPPGQAVWHFREATLVSCTLIMLQKPVIFCVHTFQDEHWRHSMFRVFSLSCFWYTRYCPSNVFTNYNVRDKRSSHWTLGVCTRTCSVFSSCLICLPYFTACDVSSLQETKGCCVLSLKCQNINEVLLFVVIYRGL